MLLNSKLTLQRLRAKTSKASMTILHEDNFNMLTLLLPVDLQKTSCFTSCASNKPELRLRIVELFPYTTEFELKYHFEKMHSDSMVIRIYWDAKVAELLYSSEFEKRIRMLGPRIDIGTHAEIRCRQNIFLNKWLVFLIDNGYDANKWLKISKN
ncbi:MAG: DUF1249 domain-containing protein [Proteobacteria bacterium]|nr:DUF1249 domain-containing protein [Pseudomonadota bacterium]